MLMILALLAGAFFAAQVSEAAGFGGALLLLPLLTRAVGIEQAVPMLTIAQLVGNASRVGFGVRAVNWWLAGTWVAKRVIYRLPKTLFEASVSVLLALVAPRMLIWP